MTQDDSRPLRTSPDTPPELVRALRALGDDARDRARIERIAQKLGPLLDGAQPVASVPSQWLRVSSPSGSVLKLALAGVLVGATVAWLAWPSTHTTETRGAARERNGQNDSAAPVRAASPGDEKTPIENAPAAAATTPDAVERNADSPATEIERTGHSGAHLSARGLRHFSRSATAAHSAGPAIASSPTRPDKVASERAKRATAAQADSRSLVPTTQPKMLSPPQAEVELLFRARAQMTSNPGAALQLLREHSARFGDDGMLVPEREVMAIEILRKLGQFGAAERRLARFRARYPTSLHLQRLDPKQR
jgi:hypothetical protein